MVKKNLNIDRTLVLRICDERLQARIQEKMAELEDEVSKSSSSSNVNASNTNNPSNFPQHELGSSGAISSSQKQESKILDLAGVSIEPAIQGLSSSTDETLWSFHCDGATYPARLTNLPCPVELHKTHDHALYYKSADVAQMLIVYEDLTALEEAESMPRYKIDGFPTYFHSGLTPPTSRIVEKRFKERVHAAIPPPVDEIREVERELIKMMESMSTKEVVSRNSPKKKTHRTPTNKIIEEVEEVVVQYEPWMDDYGNKPDGIEFDESDDICKQHPELWLDPDDLRNDETEIIQDSTTKKKKSKKKKKEGLESIDKQAVTPIDSQIDSVLTQTQAESFNDILDSKELDLSILDNFEGGDEENLDLDYLMM